MHENKHASSNWIDYKDINRHEKASEKRTREILSFVMEVFCFSNATHSTTLR